jgi:mono/diheme cytochrome c family protein
MKTWVAGLLVVLVVAVVAIVLLQQSNGFSTRTAPTRLERLISTTMRRVAVPQRARLASNPIPFSSEVLAEARAHFADHCASCHANDGGGQTEMGKNLYPRAPDMRLASTQDLSDGELYWIIENGIRLTGMPAWGPGGGNDEDTWKLVHFIRRLGELTPEQIREMEAMNPRNPAEIREELDDERFLSGEDVENSTAGAAHRH